MQGAGLALSTLGGEVTVQTVRFGSEAAKYGLTAGDDVTAVLVPAQRPSRYWFALPAMMALGGIVLLQIWRRQPRFGMAH